MPYGYIALYAGKLSICSIEKRMYKCATQQKHNSSNGGGVNKKTL